MECLGSYPPPASRAGARLAFAGGAESVMWGAGGRRLHVGRCCVADRPPGITAPGDVGQWPARPTRPTNQDQLGPSPGQAPRRQAANRPPPGMARSQVMHRGRGPTGQRSGIDQRTGSFVTRARSRPVASASSWSSPMARLKRAIGARLPDASRRCRSHISLPRGRPARAEQCRDDRRRAPRRRRWPDGRHDRDDRAGLDIDAVTAHLRATARWRPAHQPDPAGPTETVAALSGETAATRVAWERLDVMLGLQFRSREHAARGRRPTCSRSPASGHRVEKIWSTSPLSGWTSKCRTDVVGAFPTTRRPAPPDGTVLVEAHDDGTPAVAASPPRAP